MPVRFAHSSLIASVEIIENGKNYEILKTNLKPSFWRNLRRILRQNKKQVLLQFLFGKGYSYQDSNSHLEDQIQTLKFKILIKFEPG